MVHRALDRHPTTAQFVSRRADSDVRYARCRTVHLAKKKLGVCRVLRRLEDRIRELCGKVVAARDSDGFGPALSDLKSALQEHSERLRKMAATKLVNLDKDSPPERRSATNSQK